MAVVIPGAELQLVDAVLCPHNCSGNGDCMSGICLCQVQFTGGSCSENNLGYYITFGLLFYSISCTTIVQLGMRIRSEISKSAQPPTLHTACKVDIQKLIYLFVICATGSRAVYFTLCAPSVGVPEVFKKNLFTVFYPFVLSGFSVIICFWAESFHLSGLQLEKPRFLTKSFCGFVAFNAVVYIVLIAQVVANNVLNISVASKMNEIFNGCFAFLMFFVLVFFLIYGVEIFYKVKGAFKHSSTNTAVVVAHGDTVGDKHVNVGQLFQSRMGLSVQAGFQLAVTMFLMSEVVGEMWKQDLSIGDKNMMEVAFHLAELGCVLWFPCALWNVKRPGKLWVLNPRNLLNMRDNDVHPSGISTTTTTSSLDCDEVSGGSSEFYEEVLTVRMIEEVSDVCEENGRLNPPPQPQQEGECWICYDKDNEEELIQPCNCKGDMRLVHHTCLKSWLVEKSMTATNETSLMCSVCKEEYHVVHNGRLFWTPNKVQFRAWAQTFMVVGTMCSLSVVVIVAWHRIDQAVAKCALVIFLFIGEYCLLRLLGFNFMKAYNITKARALRIVGRAELRDMKQNQEQQQPQLQQPQPSQQLQQPQPSQLQQPQPSQPQEHQHHPQQQQEQQQQQQTEIQC